MRDGGGWFMWSAVALATLALVLVIVDFGVSQSNRALQASVNRRQHFINQSIQLGRINTTLIRSMAEAALNDKDDRLRAVLADNGIRIHLQRAKAKVEKPGVSRIKPTAGSAATGHAPALASQSKEP